MAKNASKLAPWLTEDKEPSTAAQWLKEAETHVDALRNDNADQSAKAVVALFEAVSAKK